MSTRPLVSICIPTYNRARTLTRSLDSALAQDHPSLEVIVSDNASTDATEAICRAYAARDPRVRYMRHAVNVGPTENFNSVREQARGEFFMWLADDDWIDANYVSSCLKQLLADSSVVLAAGAARYYQGDKEIPYGKLFEIRAKAWWGRVLAYYLRVSDNGAFYGLMRREAVERAPLRHVIGGDWFVVAAALSSGGMRLVRSTAIHREAGGTSYTRRSLARAYGVSGLRAHFQGASIAASAVWDIVCRPEAYGNRPLAARIAVAPLIFTVIVLRHVSGASREFLRRFRRAGREFTPA